MNTLFDELTGRNDNNNGKDDYFGRTEMRSSIYSNGKFEFIIYRAKFIYTRYDGKIMQVSVTPLQYNAFTYVS